LEQFGVEIIVSGRLTSQISFCLLGSDAAGIYVQGNRGPDTKVVNSLIASVEVSGCFMIFGAYRSVLSFKNIDE